MIPILLATSKHHSGEPVESIPFSLHLAWSGVGLGHISVTELVHSQCDPVLAGLDIHNEHKCAVVFCLLHGWLGSQGELDDGRVVQLVSPPGASLRIFGLPSETWCLRLSEGWCHVDLLLFRGWGCLSELFSLHSKPLLWLQLREGQGLPSSLLAPSSWREKWNVLLISVFFARLFYYYQHQSALWIVGSRSL